MATETNLYRVLSESFLKAGYKVDEDVNGVLFQPLNLMIKAKVIKAEKSESESSLVILNISCRHHEKIPPVRLRMSVNTLTLAQCLSRFREMRR